MSVVMNLPDGLAGMPETASLHQAAARLVAQAQRSLLVVNYWIGPQAAPFLDAIGARAAAGVKVTLCLDDSQDNATAARQALGVRARILVPQRSRWEQGILHAKAIVADEEHALVSSANLTGRASNQNWEIGVLVDGQGARTVWATHMNLLRQGFLREA